MRILIVHNHYREQGGESVVFAAEVDILRARGNEVITYTKDNSSIDMGKPVDVATKMLWNRRCYKDIVALCESARPDVMHVHNFFPIMSPSIHHAAKEAEVPVVQTLHNYRLVCPMAEFLRDGVACEDCLGRLPWPGILHGCYRDSRTLSAGVATMLGLHRVLGTWKDAIDAFIVPTEFGRRKFAEGGLPEEKLHVKPHFLVEDPGMGAGAEDYVLFVGRLSRTKGIEVLLEAWELLSGSGPPLRIVGEGPAASVVEKTVSRNPNIEWIGWRSHPDVMELMRQASALAFPSLSYESQGLVLLEAFACGLPVLASDHGPMSEMVEDQETGLLFPPGDAIALASGIEWMTTDRSRWRSMRTNARQKYEKSYTAESHYERIMSIYEAVLN